MGDSSVLRVDKTVDIEDALKGALEIVKLVRDSWKTSDIHYKVRNSCIFLTSWLMLLKVICDCSNAPKYLSSIVALSVRDCVK